MTDVHILAIDLAKRSFQVCATAAGGACVDLLITDVGLPSGMNGKQFADAAGAEREARPGPPGRPSPRQRSTATAHPALP